LATRRHESASKEEMKILLLCHDLTTLLLLGSAWIATDFAARCSIDLRIRRRLKLAG
jgi:hypothetical protein